MRKTALMLSAVTAAAIVVGGGGVASAATETGWTGPTLPIDGVAYLHNSTVTDDPELTASTRIWTVTGREAPQGTMGVRPRLFKSGVLCEAIDYQYNAWPATEASFSTSNKCGDGWYNSHGFVSVWNDNDAAFVEYPTFPTNPIWVAESSMSVGAQSHAEELAPEAEAAPEGFTAAYGDSGEVGYVNDDDLNQAPPTDPGAAIEQAGGTRVIPLYDQSATVVIGSFTVGG